MSAPITNQEWRAYLEKEPRAVERLTRRQLDALSASEKLKYDRARDRHLRELPPLATPHVEGLHHLAITIAPFGVPDASPTATQGIAVSGSSGLGKTTMSMHVARQHDRKERERNPDFDQRNFQPTAYFRCPVAAGSKTLLETICESLGISTLRLDRQVDMTRQAIHVLRTMETSLVILDEAHELVTRKSTGTEAGSTMKQFAESLNATFIYAGIDLATSDVLEGALGKQIAGRVKPLELTPLGYGNQDQRDTWDALISGLEQDLLLTDHDYGSLIDHAEYLHARTGGSIGTLKCLIHDATRIAMYNGTERVTKQLLTETVMDAAAERAYKARMTGRTSPEPHAKAS